MESQNEMHQESGTREIEQKTGNIKDDRTASVDVETAQQQYKLFSEFDPFRATRTRETISETDEFLSSIQFETVGTEGLDEDQLRSLSEDAQERARWSEARSDAFRGVLRLGTAVPPRSRRIL